METAKKWLISIYYLLTGISVILCLAYVVINFCFEKPKTSGYEYFDPISVPSDITSDDVEIADKIPIFEVNIAYSDTNPNLSLVELAITEYTDYEQQSYKRYVMQVVGKFASICCGYAFNV